VTGANRINRSSAVETFDNLLSRPAQQIPNRPYLAELDHDRHEQDRAIRRGYDYDSTAPSHAEY